MQAILCGYYGMGNGGDEALLATLLQMLPPHLTPLVLSGDPEQTAARYQVAAIDRKDLRQVWRALRQSQVFIWGGGSLIQDVTSALSPLYYLGLMALAQALGLRTIAWAQGIGPIQRRWNQALARAVFQRCHRVSVRDRASAQLLQDWGIPHSVGADPVWALLAHPPDANLLGPTRDKMPSPQAPIIAINLRPHPQLTPARLDWITQALIALQRQTEAQMWLVPFQASQDLGLAQQLQAMIPSSRIVQESDPQRLKGLFQIPQLVIAMRLHGLIMAAAEGCCCFGLSYDPKVTQLLAATGIPGVELNQLGPDSNLILKNSGEHNPVEGAREGGGPEGEKPAPSSFEEILEVPQQLVAHWIHQLQKNQSLSKKIRQQLLQSASTHESVITQGIQAK